MPVYKLSDSIAFPRPDLADDDGLLALGGDMSVERVLLAYELGIFPWYNENQPILWWSPPKRMILYPNKLKVSKSLKKSIEKRGFQITLDTSFDTVVELCASVKRKDEESTWINDKTKMVFSQFHEMGLAHSFEIWLDKELVGGLYGLSMGRVFFGESMFSTTTDASKVAFYHLHQFMLAKKFHFVDCQLHNNHLASLGAYEVPRDDYIEELSSALAYPDLKGKWTDYQKDL